MVPDRGEAPHTDSELSAYASFWSLSTWHLGTTLGVLDMKSGEIRAIVEEPAGGSIICGDITEDGELAATVTADGRIRVWGRGGLWGERVEPKMIQEEGGEVSCIGGVEIEREARRVMVKLYPRLLMFDSDAKGWHEFGDDRIYFNSTGRELLFVQEQNVVVYNLASRSRRLTFHGDGAKWNGPGNALFVSYSDKKDNPILEYRAASTGKLLWRKDKLYMIGGTSSDGKWFLGSTPDGFVVHEAATGKRVSKPWSVGTFTCTGAQMLWAKDRLAFSEGHVVAFWKPGKAAKVGGAGAPTPGAPYGGCSDESIQLSHSGKVVYTHGELWDIEEGEKIRNLEEATGLGFAFSHDDTYFSTWDADVQYFWRADTGKRLSGPEGDKPGGWFGEFDALLGRVERNGALTLRNMATGESVQVHVVRTTAGKIEVVAENEAGCYEGPGRPKDRQHCPGLLKDIPQDSSRTATLRGRHQLPVTRNPAPDCPAVACTDVCLPLPLDNSIQPPKPANTTPAETVTVDHVAAVWAALLASYPVWLHGAPWQLSSTTCCLARARNPK